MRRLLSDTSEGTQPIADINMTNLIDVTMVLLIVFILIAPVVDQGFQLKLPAAETRPLRTEDSLNVVVSRDGKVHLDGVTLSLDELEARATEIARRKKGDIDVVILADRDLDYGRVIQVMDAVRRAGLERLALATTEGR